MFRRLLKTDDIEVGQQVYSVRYYEARTLRGVLRYSSEIIIGPADRIILDDSSLSTLESKVARLAPATIYSRLLAARATAA
jgi:hypothetical protein